MTTGYYGNNNNVGIEGAKALCEMLKKNSVLKDLYLKCKRKKRDWKIDFDNGCTGSELGNEEVGTLCEMLRVNTSLKNLKSKGSFIDLDGNEHKRYLICLEWTE